MKSPDTPATVQTQANENAAENTGVFYGRRSSRAVMAIQVVLFGQGQDGQIFGEHCKTSTVSAHGALILLSKGIDKSKPLLVVNSQSKAEMRCRVAHQRQVKGTFEIGVEFLAPNPTFWGIHFPPEDGDPSERKRLDLSGRLGPSSPAAPKGPAKK